jgi:ubiquinone/menaquinone biosynthesis C-methylase UbiE
VRDKVSAVLGFFHNRNRAPKDEGVVVRARSAPRSSRPDWRSYDVVAPDWERVGNPQTEPAARDLIELASLREGGRLLDVGAGTGLLVELAGAALGTGGLAVGVDASIEMVVQGHEVRPAARLAAADAIDLPFRESTFDVVTANFVIFHFPQYDTALFDMIRVLKTGGRLAVSTWGPGDDEFTKAWNELAFEAVGEEILQSAYAEVMPHRGKFSDKRALEQTLRDMGLHPVRVEARQYKLGLSRQDYLEGRAGSVSGRFIRDMLGEDGWRSFYERARDVFAERFPERLTDFRDVLLALGTKATDGLQQEDSQGLAHRT